MESQLKSVVTPSESHLSRRVSVDYSKVPVDQIQREVVERVTKYLGQEDYKKTKKKLTKILKEGKVYFVHVEVAFCVLGIEGGMTILMLLQEWNLSDYILDFSEKMDEFLEACAEENK